MRIQPLTNMDTDVGMMQMWCVVHGDTGPDGTPLTVAWTDRQEDAERIGRALALTSPPEGAMVRKHPDWEPHEGGWRPKL